MKSLIILLAVFLSATLAFAQNPVWSKKYHTGSVTCLDFSGDGTKLLSGGNDMKIHLWDIVNGNSLMMYNSLKGERSDIRNLDFNSKGDWFLISWYRDSNPYISLSRTSTDTLLKTVECSPLITGTYFQYPEEFIAFLSEDSIAITLLRGLLAYPPNHAFKKGIIGKYNLTNYTQSIISTELGMFDTWCSDFSHEKIIVGEKFIDLKLGTISNVGAKNIVTCSFLHDNSHAIIGNTFGEIYVINLPLGNISDTISSFTAVTTALATDLKNRYYISTHIDSTLRLWTPGIPNIFKKVLLKSPVTTIAVSPDSVHFATAHTDGSVALWNIDSLANSAPTDTVFTSIAEENPFKNTTLTAEPNPFKNSTIIRFLLPNSLKIKLAVTDILGREVAVLKDEVVEMGEQNVVFKNENLPDGTYFITLSGDGLLKTIPVNIAR